MLDLGTKRPNTHLSDQVKLSSDDTYSTRTTPEFGNGDSARAADEEGGSGASTPPLWQPESPESRRRNYATLSPRSRTDAIARGQMELMEMVKNLPEACYELSLKDLVEVNHHINTGQERLLEGQVQSGNYARRAGAWGQRQRHRHHGQMVRSGSLDGGNSSGLLLKMVFPLPWRTRQKKKKKIEGLDANSVNNGADGVGVSEKEYWWKTRATVSPSARSESGGESGSLNSGSRKSSNGSSSTNSWSSSSNSSSRRHDDNDCWSFIRISKSRSLKA